MCGTGLISQALKSGVLNRLMNKNYTINEADKKYQLIPWHDHKYCKSGFCNEKGYEEQSRNENTGKVRGLEKNHHNR